MPTEQDKRRAIDECAKQDVKDAQRQGRNITHEQAKKSWVETARQLDREKERRK